MKIVDFILTNKYSQWKKYKMNNYFCAYRGEISYYNEKIDGEKILHQVLSRPGEFSDNFHSYKELLNSFYGTFALLIETPNIVLCAVDRTRSIPLFFSSFENKLIIADDANYIREHLNPPFCEENGAEFLVTGYVTGNETLFDGIFQVQAGEYLIFDKTSGNFSTHFYHHYWHGNFFTDSEEDLLNRLDDVFVHVFERLVASTKGYQIVVPLSGGLDSRIIVAMLKRLGVNDVICFSYGKKGNIEGAISRKVAESLGYTWYFVEYTGKRWYDCYHSDEMRAYERYAGNLTSLPHIQDFLAVKILKEEGKIPDNAVFVPGHSGDMLAGSWIPNDIENLPHTADYCLTHCLQKHYSLWRWNDEKKERLFQERIQKSIGDISINDTNSLANGIEYFNFKERQAKFILNSVRVYEFFGYDWRLPLWDAELIHFFLRVPLSLRLDQKIYNKYSIKKIFINKISPLSRIPCSTINEIHPSFPIMKIFSYLCNIFFNPDIGIMCGFKNPIIERFKCYLRGTSIFNKKNLEIQSIKDTLCIQKSRFPSCNGILTLLFLENLFSYKNRE